MSEEDEETRRLVGFVGGVGEEGREEWEVDGGGVRGVKAW